MSVINYGDLDASIQEKVDADADFQASLEGLASQEEKDEAINARKAEFIAQSHKETAEEAKKQKGLADNYKIRAEKAERKEKGSDDDNKDDKKKDEISSKDLYALMNAEVPEEDIEEVQKAAKVLEKSIPEALKDDMVKSVLKRKAEERITANAANTVTSRRTNATVSDDTLVTNLAKGEVPAKGSKEAEQLFWARRKKK